MAQDLRIIRWNPDGDGITGLYIDGKCQMWGDYYHNHISDRLEGFIEGLQHAGVEHTVVSGSIPQELSDDEWIEVTEAPDTLADVEALYPGLVWDGEPE